MSATNSSVTTVPTMAGISNFNDTFGYGELEKYDEFIAALYMNKCGLWILTIVGLVCNTLAFLTISSIKPFAASSFSVALLAILDTVVLVMRLFYQQLTAYDVSMGDAGCAIFSFLGSFFLHLSTWTLATMTIERFVAVWFPLRVSEFFTLKRAKVSILIISFILILLNMHILWMTHEYVNPFPPIALDCGFRNEYKEFEKNVWFWVNSCVYAFIPCASMIVLNALIIFGLHKSFKMQKQMINGECTSSSKNMQQRQITIMLVTVSVAFAVFLLPVCIFYLARWEPKTLRETARFYLTQEIVFFVAELHHAVNFLFYFFSSRKFRTMMIRLVTCKYPATRRSVYQSQQGATSTTQSTSMFNEL